MVPHIGCLGARPSRAPSDSVYANNRVPVRSTASPYMGNGGQDDAYALPRREVEVVGSIGVAAGSRDHAVFKFAADCADRVRIGLTHFGIEGGEVAGPIKGSSSMVSGVGAVELEVIRVAY